MEILTSLPYRAEVLSYIQASLCNDQAKERYGADKCLAKCNALIARLSEPPRFTTLRLNTRHAPDSGSVVEYLNDAFVEQYKRMHRPPPDILTHPFLPDCLLIRNEGPVQRNRVDKEVMIDVTCGMAVLRGADIFVQGILAAHVGMFKGDTVSVYVDVERRCTKGLAKIFTGSKFFVGNGIAEVGRDDVFCAKEILRGVGITMTEPVYVAPSLSDVLPHLVFPQNLPSIACVHALDPRPGELVLDLCAAPGGKTVHIATLMNNSGRVVAIDKCRSKIETVRRNSVRWNIDCIEVYCFDGTRMISDTADVSGGPPYPPVGFDRVLLDAPCSGLGQRPVIISNMSVSELTSYPPLQKHLFRQAVSLLKEGGCLVYSTCTLTLEENECIVAWALKTFPRLSLVKPLISLGGPGWPGSGLDSEQECLVQRFDPSTVHSSGGGGAASCEESQNSFNTDTIGFFIAKFIKTVVL